jgi:hypothetical protein
MSDSSIPLDIPIIAQFSYLNDCTAKIPVLIREQNGNYFMKNPVRPRPDWQMDVIIRSIDFPSPYSIKLSRTPFGEIDIWESEILEKVAHSEFAEVYRISAPRYVPLSSSGRKTPRIYCLVPIHFTLRNKEDDIHRGTCVDISETGMGLRLDMSVVCQVGDVCKIAFAPPLDSLPELEATIMRSSTSGLDRSASIGVVYLPEYGTLAKKVFDFMARRQSVQQNSEPQTGNFGFMPKKSTSQNNELLNLFTKDNI